jgi:hypothetical protein
VLGDVCQTEDVGRGCGEHPIGQVVVHRRAGLAVEAALLGEG